MKRPSLFIMLAALIRTSASALATTGEYAMKQAAAATTAAAATASSSSSPPVIMTTQSSGASTSSMPSVAIRLRLATRTDVSAIQRCNLACLPENYNSQFYCSHLRQWPELALVAEAVETDPTGREVNEMDIDAAASSSSSPSGDMMFKPSLSSASASLNPFSGFSSRRQSWHPSHHHHQQPNDAYQQQYEQHDRHHGHRHHNLRRRRPATATHHNPPTAGEPKIVAYVLGKVETRPVMDIDYDYPMHHQGRQGRYDRHRQPQPQLETVGHVTSLAVQHEFRRSGLARALMAQLQSHLQHYSGGGNSSSASRGSVSSCGLHVRVSNQAACRLYQEDGYEIESVLPHYYQDGEEAYFMRKHLVPLSEEEERNGRGYHTYSSPSRPSSSRRQASTHNYGPPLLLFGTKKIWRHGPPDVRLPRIHCLLDETGEVVVDVSSSSSLSSSSLESTTTSNNNNHNNEELLTGSM